MNILLMVSSMGAGGAERVAANLCNAWAGRGDTVTLVATYSGGGANVYKLHAGVGLIYLVDRVAPSRYRWWAQVCRLLALRKLTQDVKADVVVSFLTNVNVACLIATTGLGVPILVSERSYPPRMQIPRVLALLRNLTYPMSDRVVMQTQLGLQWLNGAMPGARGSMMANPATFPVPDSSPVVPVQRYATEGLRLLMGVGRLAPEKQFTHLLLAFAALAPANPDWILALVGAGSEEENLKQRCHHLGLGSRVVFPGRVGNLGDWYSRTDLFVLSSQFEGFPGALVEAMSYGCAVVSYDCESGPAEIIRQGHDGVLVDPQGGVTALSEAMGALMANSDERARLGENAKEVRVRFGLPAVLAQWDALFNEVRCG